MIRILFLSTALVICGGCVSGSVDFDDVATAVTSAVTGLAAHELAPDDWTSSEKAALAAAAASTTYVIGKSLSGRAENKQREAHDAGFKAGMAYGARRQFEIIQAMQKSNFSSNRITYTIPAPVTEGINKVPYNVYLEVAE
jgi:hypothetical protein